jgi:hypothetical protein
VRERFGVIGPAIDFWRQASLRSLGMALRERARLGAVALGLGAAVLAAIQILEQTVTQFNPRPTVSALITVLVAAGGVTLARARSVAARAQFLQGAIREWPMPTVNDADPLLLGIFPPRKREGSAFPPYVPRAADEAVARGLGQGGLVLLVGPARSGKSRTAYEAVRRAFPAEQQLLIPSGGSLAAVTGDVSLRTGEAIWWLDDLERFIPELDHPVLSSLLARDRTVLASIRSESWSSLLDADGDTGEQGRRLLAGACIVQLPAELTPRELAEAERLFQGLDVSKGIGIAISESGAADSDPAPAPPSPVRPPRRHDVILGLALLATAALAAVLGIVIVAGGFSTSPPPPLGAQLEKIVGNGTNARRVLVYDNLNADLHGLGQRSWIFVWRSPNGSDNLEIYDDDNGRVVRRLDVRPSAPGTERFFLVRHRLLNIDGFFQNSLVVAYTSVSLSPGELPVVITWSDTLHQYILAPLLPARDGVSSAPPDSELKIVRSLRTAFRRVRWSDSTSALDGEAVDSFVILPAHASNPPLLLVARATTKRSRNYDPVFAVTAHRLAPLVSTNGVPRLTCVWPGFESAGWLGGVKMLPLSTNSYFPIADDQSGLFRNQYRSYEYGALLSRIARPLGDGLSCDQAYPRPPPPPRSRSVLGHK